MKKRYWILIAVAVALIAAAVVTGIILLNQSQAPEGELETPTVNNKNVVFTPDFFKGLLRVHTEEAGLVIEGEALELLKQGLMGITLEITTQRPLIDPETGADLDGTFTHFWFEYSKDADRYPVFLCCKNNILSIYTENEAMQEFAMDNYKRTDSEEDILELFRSCAQMSAEG